MKTENECNFCHEKFLSSYLWYIPEEDDYISACTACEKNSLVDIKEQNNRRLYTNRITSY